MNQKTYILGSFLAATAGICGWLTGNALLYIVSGIAMGSVGTSIYERTKRSDAWKASQFHSTQQSSFR
ncbi:MAG: hypothetical protein JOY60_14525 [Burkholderiaceae bacterium]|nr:hypothetical protein [Roseateles sp.]MBV8471063.1 hypothetical protein [Burkholderiaceae bacterium]